MDLMSYVLVSIIVFLGTISGYALSLIAPEELRSGRIHLKFFYSILVGLIIALPIRIYSPIFSWIVYFIVIIFIYKLRYIKYIYLVMGVFLFFSIETNFILVSSLLFMLGMPVASIEAVKFEKDKKIKKKKALFWLVIRRYIWIIPVSLLPFLFSYL